MNAIQRRQYQMLLRLREFGNTNRELFATSPVAQEAFGSLNAALNELTVSDLLKMTASASARGSRKKEARKALLEVMVRASKLASLIRARGETLPAFVLPASKSDQALLSAARQFASDAGRFEAEFTAHGAAPSVITDLSTRLETALRDRGMNHADRTAANTRINDVLSAVLLNVRRLDLIVDSELAGNNAIRAVWKQARRIEAARGPRSGGAVETEQAPVPSPAPPSAPAEAAEPEPTEAEGAERSAAVPGTRTPATVIEMPLREVA